jgi:ABC-type glutathione transport system ATPase component
VTVASDVDASSAPILTVEDLSIGVASGPPIVQQLSLSIRAGEVLGVVGESGSGKTLTAYAIAGLLPAPLTQQGGRICLEGRSLAALTASERRSLAGARIGMVFQDPLSSFNPVRTIGSMLIESAVRHRGLSRSSARDVAIAALAAVRLPDAERLVDAYPHQLSGGQRQRAMLALARLNAPVLLIADEPTTALDPTVQLQILALLKASAAASALLLITHDLAVAGAMCDRILVMHRGQCVEQGEARRILEAPQHQYTQRLLAAVQSLAGSDSASSRTVSAA